VVAQCEPGIEQASAASAVACPQQSSARSRRPAASAHAPFWPLFAFLRWRFFLFLAVLPAIAPAGAAQWGHGDIAGHGKQAQCTVSFHRQYDATVPGPGEPPGKQRTAPSAHRLWVKVR
jgi:hypothetical protein